ncbi:uncharacterized protein F4812DRAFT_151717 [Daldinia caldariorum]|uniref:uncharacterized protein n=1 Tax=Daldinia caldariorum TaxID=326644 RepID=UPI00200818C9|nr:uncharacterized protein F4812DRAFT_151717 [Daldinia caldariorum]KAI1464714.1 hypothetical protein F4812DRAFT_151717 [Daldinia caldariorum]
MSRPSPSAQKLHNCPPKNSSITGTVVTSGALLDQTELPTRKRIQSTANDDGLRFDNSFPNAPDWKALLKTLGWETKGPPESFCRYLVRRGKSAIRKLSTIQKCLRQRSAVYGKYTGTELEKRNKDHIGIILKNETAPRFALRVEPKYKNVLNPAGFTYLAHFRWVRDKTTFQLGLDRLDDALICILFVWTGCRRRELVYGKSKNMNK